MVSRLSELKGVESPSTIVLYSSLSIMSDHTKTQLIDSSGHKVVGRPLHMAEFV